jgi:hypothetical protein
MKDITARKWMSMTDTPNKRKYARRKPTLRVRRLALVHLRLACALELHAQLRPQPEKLARGLPYGSAFIRINLV